MITFCFVFVYLTICCAIHHPVDLFIAFSRLTGRQSSIAHRPSIRLDSTPLLPQTRSVLGLTPPPQITVESATLIRNPSTPLSPQSFTTFTPLHLQPYGTTTHRPRLPSLHPCPRPHPPRPRPSLLSPFSSGILFRLSSLLLSPLLILPSFLPPSSHNCQATHYKYIIHARHT